MFGMDGDEKLEFFLKLEEVIDDRISRLRGDHADLHNFVEERISKTEGRVFKVLGVLISVLCLLGGWHFETRSAQVSMMRTEILKPIAQQQKEIEHLEEDIVSLEKVDKELAFAIAEHSKKETH